MKDKYNNIEIMAPVGSYEALSAAIQAGAGSIYFGIGKLNMRSKSTKNFTLDDLHNIATICNEHNVKSYVTINTVVFDEELDEMRQLVDAVKSNGISAIIASDQSVIQYARQIGVEVHMSTQCNITNIEAIKYYSQFADVMVTAREVSVNQVKAITRKIEEQNIRGPKANSSVLKYSATAHYVWQCQENAISASTISTPQLTEALAYNHAAAVTRFKIATRKSLSPSKTNISCLQKIYAHFLSWTNSLMLA